MAVACGEHPGCVKDHPQMPCHRLRDPHTWLWGGRLPPRLYHVMEVWASPATTQLRSSVWPSVTDGDEDSILTGGELAPEAGARGGLSQPWGALLCPPHSFSPQRPRTWKDNHLDPGLCSARGAGGHAEVEAGVGSRDGWDEQRGDVCALGPGLPHSKKGQLPEGARRPGEG